jgi:type II secretory pathway pseudopilin PulG
VSPRQRPAPQRAPARASRARWHQPASLRARRRAQGFSLIVAMLMLAVIGLASAAIMRNAVSGDQVANNNRLQTQASQYAQLALRFCLGQLEQGPEVRVARVLPLTTPPAWTAQRNWSDSGANHAHTLGAAEIGASVQPRVPPQCLAEATSLPDVYTVTARGFSSDFKADASTGATRTGSAVWVQATVHASGEAPAPAGTVPPGPLSVRERTWQQLLTPPF